MQIELLINRRITQPLRDASPRTLRILQIGPSSSLSSRSDVEIPAALPPTQGHQTVRLSAVQAGFTLVELVVTMIIVGILAAVVAPKFFERASFDSSSYFQQTQFILRYAQKLAVAQNRLVAVRLNGTSIALCFDQAVACVGTNRVLPPSGNNSGSNATSTICGTTTDWYCEAPTSPVAYTSTIPSFYFDALGKPFNTADAVGGVSTFVKLTIPITGDGTTRNVIVERETGYVH